MAENRVYKTKQRSNIESVLRGVGARHITVDELCEKIAVSGMNVGRTTVYRCLEKMAEEGKVRKYEMSGGEPACYQYIEEQQACREHFHLKCTECGALIHVECKNVDELCSHIEGEHSFKVDKFKTVLYGVCEKCVQK